MIKHQAMGWLALLVAAASVGACGTPPPPTSPAAVPSSDIGPTVAGQPSVLTPLPPERSASPIPSRQPVPTASPRERLARWQTTPRRVFDSGCGSPTATVDGSARFHVAAGCWPRIGYASSTDGKSWKASTLATPIDRFDINPVLTVDGSTLYLAFTRMRPIDPDTCGDDIPQGVVGIYYRTRTLPSGKWSTPIRIGQVGDYLQSFRVVGGVVHETFLADGGGVSYGSQVGSTFREIPIPGADATSLRIGDDGRPRIAYTTGHAIRYAVVSDSGRLSTASIFSADDVLMESPALVLGGGDHAFVSWSAVAGSDEPGCSEPPTPSHEGTWFATDVDGTWATKRLSKDIGSASLALDVATGRLHATFDDSRGTRYLTRAVDGTWSGSRLDVSADFLGLVLRRSPETGTLLLVGTMSGDDEAKNGIFALTAS